jgi:bifunctional enzyme CysN/CysC
MSRRNAERALTALLTRQGSKPALRVMTCGSVDDGKSTLVGRLLFDSQALLDDQLSTLKTESRLFGKSGDEVDFALLLDGLQAEREQGITIDVAYRFFASERRRFIVADTPGHEQYTRNMATAASTADLAVVLVDARKGVVVQTRRHTHILGLFGIRHVLLAVNKMDQVAFDADRFAAIASEFHRMAHGLGIETVTCIPVVATGGDNIFAISPRMPWYAGATVMQCLEEADVAASRTDRPFRMAVQWVNRAGDRAYCGRVASGRITTGDGVTVLPSGRQSRVARLFSAIGEVSQVVVGQSVRIVLTDEVDVGRGDVIAAGSPAPLVATRLSAQLLWFDDQPLRPGAAFVMRTATGDAGATVTALDHRVDMDTFLHQSADSLGLNDIGHVHLALDRPMVCETYRDSRDLGGFLLIDRESHRTAGAGMIDLALRRASDVPWQDLDITKAIRARHKSQRPCVLWFTGLSGAGKSTIANLVERRLLGLGRHCYLLDGDNLRNGLNSDLGFADADRRENIRRVTEVMKLFVDAGLMVLVTLISPFREERDKIRATLDPGEFVEIFVSTDLAECERRDPKGHYQRARAGDLPRFTGISSPYEPPLSPDITIDTHADNAEQAADRIVAWLRAGRYL